MISCRCARKPAGLVFSLIAFASQAKALSFTVGDFYTTDPFGTSIQHYNPSGSLVESLEVPAAFGNGTKGVSFGPDGNLYSVMESSSGYNVISLNASGNFNIVGSGSTYVAGNLSYGKINFAPSGNFYVAGQNDLIAFTPGNPTGTTIFSDNQIYDMKVLPSGNLFVLTAYSIKEITSTGSLVRSINFFLTDARGLEYNAATNDIYVTELGNSGTGYFRTIRLDATTGAFEKAVTFNYGDDIALTSTGNVVVGSRTFAPQIYDADLNFLGKLGTTPQMFVTQYSAPVPEPASLGALGLGVLALLRRKKRSLTL